MVKIIDIWYDTATLILVFKIVLHWKASICQSSECLTYYVKHRDSWYDSVIPVVGVRTLTRVILLSSRYLRNTNWISYACIHTSFHNPSISMTVDSVIGFCVGICACQNEEPVFLVTFCLYFICEPKPINITQRWIEMNRFTKYIKTPLLGKYKSECYLGNYWRFILFQSLCKGKGSQEIV